MTGTAATWLASALLLTGGYGQSARPEIVARSSSYTLPPALLTARANSVPINVVVRDRRGVPIANLQRGRFRVFDNGKGQTISAFAVASAGGAPAVAETGRAGDNASVRQSVPQARPRARYVALLFDDVNSSRGALAEARNAAVRFVREGLGGGDRMALFTTSGDDSLGFTRDAAALAVAIARVAPHPRYSQEGISPCPRITPYQAYLISVVHDPLAYKAAAAEAAACTANPDPESPIPIFRSLQQTFGDPIHMQARATWEMARAASEDTQAAIDDVVRFVGRQPGERIVVLASGGYLSGTLEAQRDAIVRDALHADVVINALDAKGLYTDGPGRPINDTAGVLPLPTYFFDEISKVPRQQEEMSAMADLAVSTGGLLFQDNNDLTLGFRRLGLAPKITYELAFSPKHLARDGKFHRLRVELSPPIKGATVEARRGYFAPSPGPSSAGLERRLAAAVRASATEAGLSMSFAVAERPGGIAVGVSVAKASLAFTTARGRHLQKLAIVAALFDPGGRFLTGERGEVSLALKSGTFKRYHSRKARPLRATFTLQAPPGAYNLRVVIEEASDGRLAAASRSIHIR